MLTPEIKHAILVSIKAHLPFVAYILPDSNDVIFFADIPTFEIVSDRRFLINTWSGGTVDEYIIRDCADASRTIDYVQTLTPSCGTIIKAWPHTTSCQEYESSIEDVLDHLQNHGGKVVVSRTITGSASKVDWAEVADRYFALHDEAFRYIYFTPRHGCWLGASPEILLKVSDGKFMTMALAGTRPIAEADSSWSGKNIAEQAIVRNYIVDRLYDLGLDPHCSSTETLTTGNIQHLSTVITGRTESSTPHEILRSLNPTPALAGYPLSQALERIADVERHPRRCYGGYVAVDSSGVFVAYVNLRCVNFDADKWCMYVGSGIMPDSIIEDEWIETEAKSKILRSIIEDSHK